MKKFMISLLLVFPTFSNLMACPGGMVQGEKVLVPIDAKNRSPMTEQRFDELLLWFHQQYESIIREDFNAELKIISDWSESMANAFAQRDGNQWILRVLGGLGRHPLITEDAFVLVLCHEMGHQIGGAPKKRDLFSTSWSSSEGQADYYATLKCLRKVWKDQENDLAIAELEIPDRVVEACQNHFTRPQDIALCKRSNMASLSHAQFLNRRDRLHSPVAFDTPDRSSVRRTNHKHPKPQCRLDTTFAGALCPIEFGELVSQNDFRIGTCHDSGKHPLGVRPSCWFNPKR